MDLRSTPSGRRMLPFVGRYRTLCLAPEPYAKQILLGIQKLTPLSALRCSDGTLFVP
jgi:hypothetical protein